jgi:hypothetical protein
MREVLGRVGRRRKQLLDDLSETRVTQEIDRVSTRWHSVKRWLWERVWTCSKADYRVNDAV